MILDRPEREKIKKKRQPQGTKQINLKKFDGARFGTGVTGSAGKFIQKNEDHKKKQTD